MISTLLSLVILLSASAEDSKLVQALEKSNLTQVQALSKNKAELNWKDSAGNDALFYAVSLNDEKAVDILLKAGASTKETYGDKKESLLFEAARLGGEKVAELIIKKETSILKRKNSENENPVFEAVRAGQTPFVKYLLNKGLSTKEKNKSGKTPKDFANSQDKDLLKLLN